MIEIKDNKIYIHYDNPTSFLSVVSRLEGRKRWMPNKVFRCEDTRHNQELIFGALGKELPKLGKPMKSNRPKKIFTPKVKSFPFQVDCLKKGSRVHCFFISAEMGTGKTKMAIDIVNKLFCQGKVDQCIVFAPKGVHEQWVDEIPKHTQRNVHTQTFAWDGKGNLPWLERRGGSMRWATFNYESSIAKKGKGTIYKLLQYIPPDRTVFILDESHLMKSDKGKRYEQIKEMLEGTAYRLALTGTPILNNILDYKSQMDLLDESIIGMKYKTTFKAYYCIEIGEKDQKKVIGSKNTDVLYSKVEPYTYRITKKEAIGLPDKVYDEIVFSMEPEQKRYYQEIKNNLLIELEDDLYPISNAAVALMRLQQITNGYLVLLNKDTKKEKVIELPNPRVDALIRSLDNFPDESILIWARFNYDIEQICKALKKAGKNAAHYYGKTKEEERRRAKEQFINRKIQYLVASPAAAGRGTDGLQNVCNTCIYYSNSFTAEHRWQSEDRIHRIGTTKVAAYIDIICRGGIDRKITNNLKNKKSISKLTLDEVRGFFQ